MYTIEQNVVDSLVPMINTASNGICVLMSEMPVFADETTEYYLVQDVDFSNIWRIWRKSDTVREFKPVNFSVESSDGIEELVIDNIFSGIVGPTDNGKAYGSTLVSTIGELLELEPSLKNHLLPRSDEPVENLENPIWQEIFTIDPTKTEKYGIHYVNIDEEQLNEEPLNPETFALFLLMCCPKKDSPPLMIAMINSRGFHNHRVMRWPLYNRAQQERALQEAELLRAAIKNGKYKLQMYGNEHLSITFLNEEIEQMVRNGQ